MKNWKLWNLKVSAKDGDGDGAGGNGSDWIDGLPDDVKEWDEVKNAGENPEKFWESMTNLRSMMGQSLRIPGKEAGEDAIKEFHETVIKKVPGLMLMPDTGNEDAMAGLYRQLGMPEKADEYEIPKFDDDKYNKEFATKFKGIAHKAKLNKTQFKELLKDMMGVEKEAAAAGKQQLDESYLALSKKWGAAFDERLELVTNLATKTKAPEQFMTALKNRLVAPATLEWLHGMATAFGGSEGLDLLEGGETNKGIMTPAEAKAEIDDIMNNKQHAYWVAQHPQHQTALTRMIELRKLANPGASSDLNDLRAGGISPELAGT